MDNPSDILSLVEAKSPVLRAKASPLPKTDKFWQQIAQDMIRTMNAKNGIGLAAPQVGLPVQLFVIRSKAEPDKTWTFFNPEVICYGDRNSTEVEGCLSIPNVFVPVERPKKIVVKYYDDSGKQKKTAFEGLMARVFQHEIDHLNGIMIIDRTNEKEKTRLRQFLEKQFGISPIAV